MEATKFCPACEAEKPKSEFSTGHRKCKPCHNAEQRARRQADADYAERYREYHKNYYRQHKAQINRRRSEPGTTNRETSDRPLARLTPQELATVELLLAGHTTYEAIADQMILSARTVQTHLANVYGKLQIGGMVELVLVAVAEGMEVSATWEQIRDKRSDG